jgi:hypothetical protein
MLEDELREMFGSRVSAPPATMDAAGVAIDQGRRSARRRRMFSGVAAVVAFAALLSAAAVVQVFTRVDGSTRTDVVTYEGIYGVPNGKNPVRGSDRSTATLVMPVDVFDGSTLWTAEGREYSMPGVMKVARVPAGWLYSDASRLSLLTEEGDTVQLRANVKSWAVSLDGSKIAVLADANVLETWRPTGGLVARATVPPNTWPAGFDGESKVILANSAAGFDHWSGGGGSDYKQTWNQNVLAVYGAQRDRAVGVVREGGSTCLADLVPADEGWRSQLILGCGELATHAVASTTARSPDGRWLAVSSSGGLELVDLAAARRKGTAPGEPATNLTAPVSCVAQSFAEAVWADDSTVLTASALGGAVACGTSSDRRAVPLTAMVRDGWSLIPNYGVKSDQQD